MPKWRTPRGPQLRHCAKVALAAVAAYALTLGGRNEYALYSVHGCGAGDGWKRRRRPERVAQPRPRDPRRRIGGTALAYLLGMSVWSLGIAVAMLAWLSIGLGWGKPALRAGIAMARGWPVYAYLRRRAIRYLASAEHESSAFLLALQ